MLVHRKCTAGIIPNLQLLKIAQVTDICSTATCSDCCVNNLIKMPDTVTLQFLQFLQQYNYNANGHKWLVAVSGGIDSVVLCHLCKMHGVNFAMAHCNFQLRGADSDSDESFVIQFAEQLSTQLFVQRFDTKKYMAETGKSVQVAARDLRYNWFYELMDGQLLRGAEPESFSMKVVLATAHHANDNIETVLMNLFRGTGIRGMRGIQPVQEKIIRPLLGVTKEAIVYYAKSNGLNWAEDSSNSSDKYTRNFIRNQVVPLMEQVIPREEMGFEKSMEMMAEAALLYDEAIAIHKKKLLEVRGAETHIPVLKLAASKPLRTIVFEIIKDFNFNAAQTDEVLALLQSESGRYVASATHRIIRNRAWLIIAPQKTEASAFVLIEKKDGLVTYDGGELQLTYGTFNDKNAIPDTANIALLNAAEITYPLILRPWQAGDYFYPLGMLKKKKLARFFIDRKLSKTDKEKIWVIESNKKILWVVGYRIDERFKVVEGVENTILIEIKPKM